MKKISARKLLSNPKKFSQLGPTIFVAVFAVVGVVYLLASHAAVPATVSVPAPAYGNWYRDSTSITAQYIPTCDNSGVLYRVIATYPVTLPGLHDYAIWQESYPIVLFTSVDTPALKLMPNGNFCDYNIAFPQNASPGKIWEETIGIDTDAPSVGFSSSSSTTQSTGLTVTGHASDASSGLATVAVNGVPATLSAGSFTATVPLSLGSNNVVAIATDHVGHTAASGAITITRVAPPPPAPPPPVSHTGSSSGSSSSSSKTHSSTSTSSGSGTTQPGIPDTSSTSGSDTTSGDTTDTSQINGIASSSQPNVPSGKNVTITSGDNLVSVAFQKGTFDTDAYCSIDQGDTNNVPVRSTDTVGPYSIDCTDGNGNPLNDLKKSAAVTITTPSSKGKYAAYVNNAKWVTVASSNNGKTVSFKLAKAEEFATAPGKAGNSGAIILNVIGLIVLAVFLGGGIFFLRRRQQDPSAGPDYWQG